MLKLSTGSGLVPENGGTKEIVLSTICISVLRNVNFF